MDGLDRWHAERKAQLAQPSLAAVERDMSRTFGVRDTDLNRFMETTRAVNAELRSIDQQMRDHANSRARLELPPVRATMQALHAKRQAAVQSGLGKVQSAVGAEAWNGIAAYINGRLRDSITTVRLGNR